MKTLISAALLLVATSANAVGLQAMLETNGIDYIWFTNDEGVVTIATFKDTNPMAVCELADTDPDVTVERAYNATTNVHAYCGTPAK